MGVDALVLEPVPAPGAEAGRADEHDPVVGVLAGLVCDTQGVGEEPCNVVFLLAVYADPVRPVGPAGFREMMSQSKARGGQRCEPDARTRGADNTAR